MNLSAERIGAASDIHGCARIGCDWRIDKECIETRASAI